MLVCEDEEVGRGGGGVVCITGVEVTGMLREEVAGGSSQLRDIGIVVLSVMSAHFSEAGL